MFKIKATIVCMFLICIFFGCTNAVLEESNTEPIPDLIKYNPDIQNILSTHCTNCHSGNNPQASISLESYEDARFHSEEGQLLERIEDMVNPMPPGALLPANEIAIIKKWAQEGFLEN